jgi:hypothetical protein
VTPSTSSSSPRRRSTSSGARPPGWPVWASATPRIPPIPPATADPLRGYQLELPAQHRRKQVLGYQQIPAPHRRGPALSQGPRSNLLWLLCRQEGALLRLAPAPGLHPPGPSGPFRPGPGRLPRPDPGARVVVWPARRQPGIGRRTKPDSVGCGFWRRRAATEGKATQERPLLTPFRRQAAAVYSRIGSILLEDTQGRGCNPLPELKNRGGAAMNRVEAPASGRNCRPWNNGVY